MVTVGYNLIRKGGSLVVQEPLCLLRVSGQIFSPKIARNAWVYVPRQVNPGKLLEFRNSASFDKY